MLGPRRCGQRARARARHRARRFRAAVSAATPGGGKRDDGGAGRIEAEPNSPPSGAVLAAEAARRGKREGSGRRRRKSREEEGDPTPRPRLHPTLRSPWPTREGTGRMEGNPAAAAHESGAGGARRPGLRPTREEDGRHRLCSTMAPRGLHWSSRPPPWPELMAAVPRGRRRGATC